MHYTYTARTKHGDRTKGVLDASSVGEAEELLVARGYFSVRMRTPGPVVRLRALLAQFERPRPKDVVVFLRQFSVMVSARVPIVTALRALIRQTASPALRAVVTDLVRDVESGIRLSDAMAAHPKTFSNFAVHIVRAGETSGKLDEVVNYLADQSEHDEELRSKVRGAMVYPAFIVFGLGAVAVIMMVFVIPRLTAVLAESGAELPFATRALVATSGFLVAWWWLLGILLAAAVVGFRWSLRWTAVRERWDAFTLAIPVFGTIGQYVAVVRLTTALATLLRGGVDMVPALEVVRGIMGNAVFERLLMETIAEVRDGRSMTSVFATAPAMPLMVTQLLAVGEETGRIEAVLEKLAAFYRREVDQLVRNLVTIIEPVIMIIMGVGVGIMVAAVIMPMYNLAAQF